MLPLCVEIIPKMNGVSKTNSTIPMSILIVTPPTLLKRTSLDLARRVVEHIPKKQLSPQMIKRPPATIVHKDPQSYQLGMTNHVENGQES